MNTQSSSDAATKYPPLLRIGVAVTVIAIGIVHTIAKDDEGSFLNNVAVALLFAGALLMLIGGVQFVRHNYRNKINTYESRIGFIIFWTFVAFIGMGIIASILQYFFDF